MRVLVLNAGSSSLKASVVDAGETLLRTTGGLGEVFEALGGEGLPVASIEAVGHRVVHGGEQFQEPALLDDAARASLGALGELAPLHNDVALETIRAARRALPGVPHVACFDTAFHSTLPESAARYPVPETWWTEWGIRRFGFHGLSVAWAVERAGELLGRPSAELEILVAHLGSGCSVTAVSQGRSIATSMGFTPLEGLMMGTRSGSVDPGVLLHLLRTGRMSVEALDDALHHDAGLLGVSGRSADVRELEAAADGGDERARLALDMFVDRAAAGIAAAAVALRRLDGVVFTGGIGENAGRIRAAIADRLSVLGIQPISPNDTGEDRVLPLAPGAGRDGPSGPAVLRIEAREDLVIAREAAALLSS